jgi:chaperonin GroES
MKASVLFNAVLVKLVPLDEVQAGKIIVADVGSQAPNSATRGNFGVSKGAIVKCGPGAFRSDGTRVNPTVREGDVVLFEMRSGRPVLVEGEEYWTLQENSILLVFHDKDGESIEPRLAAER